MFSHTAEGIPYRIACEVTGDEGRVIVDDGGPGIPERALDRGISLGGGTGLGLDVARSTVRTAGGSLAVEKSPLGGARVVMTFPGYPANDGGEVESRATSRGLGRTTKPTARG